MKTQGREEWEEDVNLLMPLEGGPYFPNDQTGHPLATQQNRTPTLISDDEPEEDPKEDSEEDSEDGMEEDSKSKEETEKKELVTYVTPISVVAPTMSPPLMTHRLGSRMHRIRKIV